MYYATLFLMSLSSSSLFLSHLKLTMLHPYILITRSPTKDKKFRAELPDGKTVDFGQKGYSDYTIHKDPARMRRYLFRHRLRENWGKSGMHKAGFWSRWLLWSKPCLDCAKKLIEKKFNVRIVIRWISGGCGAISTPSSGSWIWEFASCCSKPL